MNFTSSPFERMMKEVPHPGWDNDDPCKGCRYYKECKGKKKQCRKKFRALIVEPEFIVADEPISALDMSIRAQVLNLLRHLQKERGITYLFIAHDLSVMRYISDRIAVIHKGRIVELAGAEELTAHAIHPYTRSLLSAIPLPNPVVEKRRVAETYDYASSGIDYNKGTDHLVSGSHYVKCTDEEFAKWCK